MARAARRRDLEALREMEVLGDLAEQAERLGAAADADKMRRRIAELGKRVSG